MECSFVNVIRRRHNSILQYFTDEYPSHLDSVTLPWNFKKHDDTF